MNTYTKVSIKTAKNNIKATIKVENEDIHYAQTGAPCEMYFTEMALHKFLTGTTDADKVAYKQLLSTTTFSL